VPKINITSTPLLTIHISIQKNYIAGVNAIDITMASPMLQIDCHSCGRKAAAQSRIVILSTCTFYT
jgi:hypothetical protein